MSSILSQKPIPADTHSLSLFSQNNYVEAQEKLLIYKHLTPVSKRAEQLLDLYRHLDQQKKDLIADAEAKLNSTRDELTMAQASLRESTRAANADKEASAGDSEDKEVNWDDKEEKYEEEEMEDVDKDISSVEA